MMAGAESPKLKQESQNASTENSNENPRERNPPGGGNRGPRGRKGGTRFSGGRGGGMGGGNRNNDGPMKMNDPMDGGMDNTINEGIGGGMGGGMGIGRGGGMRGGRGGRGGGDRNMGNRSQDDRLMERIMAISGPTHDLPPPETTEKKFSGRNRLYIGNLSNDVTEEEIQQIFQQYGEISELFVNKEKNFAFLRMDYRVNAEKAKHELDGKNVFTNSKGRALKVRFAPHSSTVKVKNLTPWITNELLERAFSVFGEIERAIVIADDKGKSTGEGIVEFCRKPSAQLALRKCTEGCYFLTASLRPVVVKPFELLDDIDGYSDKNLPRKNQEFFTARDIGPRFAKIGSFEYEYGTRWKQLHELYEQKEEALKREMAMEEEKLEAQMEFARYEHETELLREQLRMREADRERQKREWEMKERQAEEQRTREEELRRRQQEEMAMRIRRQEEELHRRQQENNLFMQEQTMRGGGGGGMGGKNYDSVGNNDRDGYGQPDGGSSMPVDPKSFMDAYNSMDRGSRGGYNDDRSQIMDLMDMRVDMGNMGGGRGGSGGSGRWQGGSDRNRQDDYPNKRRRY
ncbi:hrp65 protein-like isoform X1 [Bombus pyrosoma]|uniref:hrp65 protein-like isoform X1 n=1 Tax=Bombus pyrosoma TaxID=396416 RepID=UPI001CB938BF|nr:hrp65 protein-like isoform X1 [Bombus pyrosoma]XP_043587171.1 hrp65 protein-like isoform X1 [Bombus pyrosoma]